MTYISTSSSTTGTITVAGGTSTYNYNYNAIINKYLVLRLPEDEIGIPNKIYVGGLLLTSGILGSDVQAAFSGESIVFAPGVLNCNNSHNNKITIILDYGRYIYNYNIEASIAYIHGVQCEDDSNMIVVKLLSKVAQR